MSDTDTDQEPETPVVPLTAPREGVPSVVSTPDEFASVAARLAAGTGPISVDTERASGFKYSQRAYLVQLRRTGSGSFLLDPIPHPEALTPIIDVMTGPQWILHAADQDLPCLRELGFVCENLFDTELAGRLLNVPKVNLAAMVAEFLHLGLAKGHGAADWSRRPLPDDWLNYAALDVEVLVELRDAVSASLRETGRDQWALEEFAAVLARPPAEPKTDRWRRTSGIHGLKAARQLATVRELWSAREEIARRRDIAPGRILPDSAIVHAATTSPKSVAELTALPVFGGPRQRRQASTWLAAIDRARTLPEAELPPKKSPQTGVPPINRWEPKHPVAAARAHAVRPAVKELAESIGVPAENLLAPSVVRDFCWFGLTDGVDVAARLTELGARPWQVGLAAEAIEQALDPPASGPATTSD
ncbi:ribonuclease D [Gordonia sp. HY366]|uniref:Ribonuclease D n=1 Tax=Gordonia liuliyuniae TaxID=2911517 RepID=A0ABS9IRA6_9ACTN|nr:ribonuclease D [Gordonia liuliyuniae]MCF8588071.1 ribonuclease D [Gordonia liuliyuniae]